MRDEPFFSLTSIISRLLFENVSILRADGNLSILKSSCAASLSGFSDMERSRCVFMNPRLLSLYSGERIRATVFLAPSFFAIKQLSILSSSDAVTAI